jgi:3-dehydroquinate synthase
MIDTDTLRTLPDRELKAGMAEVIKHGAVCDIEFFNWLEENMAALLDKEPAALAHAIQRCCEIKAGVVAEDEREAGRRAILNFGHTFGHAIEHCVGYGECLHGEAVAIGMIMAAELSGIAEAEVSRLRSVIAAAGLPVTPPAIAAEDWMRAMAMDKKVQQKKLRFVLLKSLGNAHLSESYDAERLRRIVGRSA